MDVVRFGFSKGKSPLWRSGIALSSCCKYLCTDFLKTSGIARITNSKKQHTRSINNTTMLVTNRTMTSCTDANSKGNIFSMREGTYIHSVAPFYAIITTRSIQRTAGRFHLQRLGGAAYRHELRCQSIYEATYWRRSVPKCVRVPLY